MCHTCELLPSADRAHSTSVELVFARFIFQALSGIFLHILSQIFREMGTK